VCALCRGKNDNPKDYCDPYKEKCDDIRMFQFDNHYYTETCTPDIIIEQSKNIPDPDLVLAEPEPRTADFNVFESMKVDEVCKFSSVDYR
jgi:hypothetical protein